MPAGLTNFMTRDEFLDLVAFLSVLGKPGDYEIRTTPTIQRWRVLPIADADEGVDPDDAGGEDLPSAIAAASPASWLPAYSLVSGELPIDSALDASDADQFAIRGEIDVTKGGTLRIAIEAPDNSSAWLDGAPVAANGPIEAELDPGRHVLTLLVASPSDQESAAVRVAVTRAEGSPAEFTVVGGP